MKIKTLTAAIFLMAFIKPAFAQAVYDVAKIPADLLTNATSVVRNEEQIFTIRSESSATYSYKTALTILSENAESSASMSEYYDKFSSISNLKATMYDAKGIKIKSYKSGDFKDQSITGDGTMYDDNRMKKLDFLNTSYPYTIEYSYDIDYNGYLTIPGWSPVGNYDCAVEKSAFTLQIPKELTFRYLKSEGLKTDSSLLNNKMVYKWTCQNLSAIVYEPLSTGLSTVTPWVLCSPDKFEYDNYKGNVSNWQNLGKWVYDLSANVQVLPEPIKAKVKNLIADAKTDKEKIGILYKYLQSNTRYVGIQLGIGGFRPMAADKVAAVNYGDCKALSNYMKTLLSEAGIASNLVILGSGRPSLNRNFSSFTQANHMIVCIPAEKDTTWLECTSQHIPAGFIGNDNAARTVMMVTKDGGKLVTTPVYKPEDNYLKNITTIKLTADGGAVIDIKNSYGAAQYQNRMLMMLLEPTEQRKRLMNGLGLPNMTIQNASFKQPDPSQAVMEEDISVTTAEVFSKGADKLFLTLNMLNRRESVPAKVENRKTPFSVAYGYKDTDQVTFVLPAGFKIDFLPKDILLESEFGSYSAKTMVKDNTIIYSRTQMMNAKKYGPEKYQALVDFYKKIYLADKQKAILAMNK
jgi:hypothetical protein